jgi:adenosylmethionine-8-amino-7-oxononanoate aminotransferase
MGYREQAQQHLVPHFTRAAAWRSESLPVFVRGEGAYLVDEDGSRHLDGLSGLFCSNLGHGRADLAAVAAEQMERLAFSTNWGQAHPPSVEAAKMIADLAPGDLNRTFFVSSGSEAVESALKLARCIHLARGESGRYKAISRDWSYHGTTLGALSVTGIPKFRDPFTPMLWDGTRKVPNTLGAVIPPGGTAADLACVQEVEETILREGPESVALVIAEPVQNGRGALVPPEGYWQELRRICDRYGVLLVADEVINAFGRLGHWFGSERFGVIPDMITFAKGVTSAYLPLGGVIVRDDLVEALFDSPLGTYMHGSTFGGHPVATAVAAATLNVLRDEKVLENVRENESSLAGQVHGLREDFSVVKDTRGCGYFYAIELMADSMTGRELTAEQSSRLLGGLLATWLADEKLLIRPDDRGATMLVLSPPLISSDDVLNDLMSRVRRVLERTQQWTKVAAG